MSGEALLIEVIKQMVDKPKEVGIENRVHSGDLTVLDINVADSDIGKAVGRGGLYADALRTIFSAIYGKEGKRIILRIKKPRNLS